ncbi:MAG: alkaline phosphatase family protein [Caulobacteraceae bacterium]
MLKISAAAVAALLMASGVHAATTGPVFVIALENHNFTQPKTYRGTQQIFGNPAAPFINSLFKAGTSAAQYVSYATNYTNLPGVHPSEPNYVWSQAGFHGPLNDNDPYPNNIVGKPNLNALLQAAGMTWKSYQEDTDLVTVNGKLTNTVAPSSQWTVPLVSFSGISSTYTNPYNGSHQYEYAAKHNPPLFFTATNGGNNNKPSNPEAKYYAPLQQLSTDLANNTIASYNWITPDTLNDMHTPLNGGFTYGGVHYTGDAASIAQADNFLSRVVPMIEASQAFRNGGVIVIWNDETEGGDSGKFTSTEIVISNLSKGNAYHSSIGYTHSSDLRTWQSVFGLSPTQGHAWLGGAASATSLSALFLAGVIP